MFVDEVEEGADAVLEVRLEGSSLGHVLPRGDRGLAQLRPGPVDARGEQALLRPEVAVDQGLGDADAFGDALEAAGVVAPLGEDRLRDGEDLLLPLGPRHTRGTGRRSGHGAAGHGSDATGTAGNLLLVSSPHDRSAPPGRRRGDRLLRLGHGRPAGRAR